MSSNFNFYVNRQGVQGKRGAKGEQGFSPVISVESQTANEYILKVENEDGSFTTPNLRGNAIENNGGTYIRFNPDTEQMYTGYADGATTEQAGVVRMGTYEDLVAGESEEVVPNVADVHNYVQNSIGSIGGVVTTEQFNAYTSETAITLDNLSNNKLDKSTFDSYTSTTNSTLESLSTNKVNVSDYTTFANNTNSALSDLSTNKLNASTFDSFANSTSSTLSTLESEKLDFTDLSNSLVEGANVTLTKDTVNKTITISSSGSAQVQANWTETDSSNPSFIQNKPTLGTMASEDASNYTPTTGLSDVAISGSYNDLLNKPTIPAAQVNADWNATSGVSQILNKPILFSGDYNDLTNKPVLGSMASESASDYTPTANLANIATTGDYDDLINKPTIPAAQVQSDWNQSDNTAVDFIKNKPTIPTAANNATITITQGGITKGSFTTDQATNGTIDIDAVASITVDSVIDSNSENPVQNKVIAEALNDKQDAFNTNIPLSMQQEIISPATNGSGTGYYYYYNDTNGYNEAPYIRYIGSSGSSSDYRHTSTIPFEFNKIYKLTGVTGELVLSNGRPLSTFYAFGKYVPDLNKVVPYMMLPKVGASGVVSSQTFNLITHDTTGEAVVDSYTSESCSISQATGSDLGTGMFCQKKLISGKIVLYIGARFRGSFYLYTIQDASGSTSFTNIMNDCNNIILMTSDMRNVIGSRYSDAEDDLINITSATQLGTADASMFISEPILGNINLDLNYDNSTIKVNSSNQIYVDQSALTSKQDALVSGTNIKTINGTSVLGSGDITTGNVSSTSVNNIVQITQADYDALTTKDANTQYIITDAPSLALADLSNINATQSAKNEIVSWGMPDWNNKITITSVPYTAPCAGIVSLFNASAGSFTGNSISVNGKQQILFNAGNNGAWNLSGYVIVDKNDVVTCSHFSETPDFDYFVPMKGAN